MQGLILLLPLLISLSFAIATLLFWGRAVVLRTLALIGTLSLLACSSLLLSRVVQWGVLSIQIGNWPAPYGITIAADLLSAVMLVVTSAVGFLVAIFTIEGIDGMRVTHGFYTLYFVLLMGVSGAFLSGDIFNLYVWFEVMLMASFVLMALGGERAQLEGAIKYVILNLMASALFLTAIGILYSIAGTLNMADLSLRLPNIVEPQLITVVAILFLVAFGIKSAAFPFFFWLPASYHTPPVAVTALFSGLLTKVGVYSLVRVFTLLFLEDVAFTHNLILILAGFTMVTGVLGAAAQYDMRRLLSFHIISQIGYLLMGLGIFSLAGLASTLFFMVHVISAKSALFLIAEIVKRITGSYDLRRIGGLFRTQPGLALLFMIPALSLAGLPPLAGFFGKLGLIRAGLADGRYVIVAVSLGVSLLTLFSMMKIWIEAFWKPAPDAAAVHQPLRLREKILVLPAAVLALAAFLLGLIGEPVYRLAEVAAAQLLDPMVYITAVLWR